MLAETQLIKEGKEYKLTDILDYAIRIRRYMDLQERNKKVAVARWKK